MVSAGAPLVVEFSGELGSDELRRTIPLELETGQFRGRVIR